jgi:DNA topoisomerase IA
MKTFKEVWYALHNHFLLTSWSTIALLERQLQTITQGHQSCTDFIEEFKSLVDQLTTIRKSIND